MANPSRKYHGQTTVLLYIGTVDTAPSTDLSGASREITVDEKGQEQDVSTRDDFIANATAYLANPPQREVKISGLDTKPSADRPWANIKVQDEGRIAVYPYGTASKSVYEIGNVVCTGRNFSSPHDNAAKFELTWRVNGPWTAGAVA